MPVYQELVTKNVFFVVFCFVFVIYNKLLQNHLWSCVLKLVSELHDFI